MNTEEFRAHGKKMIDYICEYGKTIENRDVAPTVDPGFLRHLIPGKSVAAKSLDCISVYINSVDCLSNRLTLLRLSQHSADQLISTCLINFSLGSE